jgi:hypothetical protein
MLLYTASEVQLEIANEAKIRRKWLKYSREKASDLSGIPSSTIRKFEDTGEISLRQFLMLLQTYGDLSIMDKGFENPPAKTMDELIELAGKEK